MKTRSFLLLALLTVLAAAASVFRACHTGLTAGFITWLVLDVSLASLAMNLGARREAKLFTPTTTLVLPILTGWVIEAFKPETPELAFFSTDFGGTPGSMPLGVKFNQEIISQIAQVPTVVDYNQGDDLTSGAQSVSSLVTDVKVKINRARCVKLTIDAGDAQNLLIVPAFKQQIIEAVGALGRDVVMTAVSAALGSGSFSQSNVTAAASTDLDVLEDQRVDMNAIGTHTPRFFLGTSDCTRRIAEDPRVFTTLQGYGQQMQADPYTTLNNLKGFTTVREYPAFPTGNYTVGAFTSDGATPTLTLTTNPASVANLYNGDRVQVSNSGGALPTGLAAATNYYVVGSNANSYLTPKPGTPTFQLSATLGGEAITPSGAGTGTQTVTRNECMQGIGFEKRAIHIAFRPMIDSIEIAKQFGIPVNILSFTEMDPVTGMSVTGFMWLSKNTQAINLAFVVQFGVQAGRGMNGTADPSADPVGSALDYGAIRLLTA